MRFEWFVGSRYISSTTGRGLSLRTALAAAGVAVGVAALVIFVSVTGGFIDAFRDRVLGVNSHINVNKYGIYFSEYRDVQETIEGIDGVTETAPYILYQMQITAEGSRSRPGVLVKGVEVETLHRMADVDSVITEGGIDGLVYDGQYRTGPEPDDPVGIAIGAVLAEKIGASRGDFVRLVSPLHGLQSSGLGLDEPRAPTWARAQITAVIDTGFLDYDSRLVLIDYRALQDLFGRGDVVTGVEVRVRDPYETGPVVAEIDRRLMNGRYNAMAWPEINRNLFASLQLQKLAFTLVGSSIVLVSSFVVLCVLIMIVLEKRKEIGILRSLGATPAAIVRIFMLEGIVIGAVGTAGGLMLGYLVCLLIGSVDFGLELEVYRIDELPVAPNALEFALAGAGAMVICFLATILPALRAAGVSPVDVLRYE